MSRTTAEALASFGLDLRSATDEDSWDVIALIAACWSEYPGCVMDVDGECPDLRTPASSYERDGGTFWVTLDPCGTVVATVGIRPGHHGFAELERLYVHRRWRRRGIAGVLADLVESKAVDSAFAALELWSDSRFVDAHRFYERRGYKRTGPDRELGDLSNTVEHHFAKQLK